MLSGNVDNVQHPTSPSKAIICIVNNSISFPDCFNNPYVHCTKLVGLFYCWTILDISWLIVTLLHFIITIWIANHRRENKHQRPLTMIQKIYLFLHLPIFIISTLIPLIYPTMEFLPLLIFSVFCSIGILCEFIGMYDYFLKVK